MAELSDSTTNDCFICSSKEKHSKIKGIIVSDKKQIFGETDWLFAGIKAVMADKGP